MKTKLKIFSVLLLICAMGYFQQKSKVVQSELLLLNVEALANNESSDARCMGIGSVDCPINNDKVYFIF